MVTDSGGGGNVIHLVDEFRSARDKNTGCRNNGYCDCRNNKNIFLISGLGSNPVARVKSEFHDL